MSIPAIKIESTAGSGGLPYLAFKTSTPYEWGWGMDQDTSNRLNLYGGGSSVLYFVDGGAATFADDVNVGADLYIEGDCSALTFTDRSPLYVGGDALKLLGDIKPKVGTVKDGWAEVDHTTLGMIRKDKKEEPGRDLGMNIQLNTAAILELLVRVKTLEAIVASL